MIMQIPFTKMHGLGNDFIVLDLVSNFFVLTPDQIKILGDRRFGIGFDQLLQVEPPSEAEIDFNYRIFNMNGEEVEHCGNGARCFARFVKDKGLSDKNLLKVKTVNRVLTLELRENGEVTVDMERPEFSPSSIPFNNIEQSPVYTRTLVIKGVKQDIEFTALSMGNPHAVIIVEDLDNMAVKDIGEVLGKHLDFPEGVNVGFAQIVSREEINLRVFERGAGETLACGTGACAAVAAGCLRGLLGDTVKVNLLGGQLTIKWQQGDSPVLMTGPVKTVYEGTIEL